MHASRSNGLTLINLVVLTVMVGVAIALVTPSYYDMRAKARRESDAIVTSRIMTGISTFYSRNLKYPQTLDNATAGEASAENRLFTQVLNNGVENGWSKIAKNYYCRSHGLTYHYNSKTGEFAEY